VSVRGSVLALSLLLSAAQPASGQDALRGKLLYHDIGRIRGAGVSCVDCHGGIPGALSGLQRVAGYPAGIAYAIGAIMAMTPLRGRVTDEDMADIAAYVADPRVPSPDPRVALAGPAATPYERLEFTPARPAGTVHLTNVGALPLRLTAAPTIAGPDSASFAIASTGCVAGQVLAAHESCAVEIAFRTEAATSLRTATLRLAHAWIGGGTNIALISRSPVP
jgi:mono/diheme cytochrome c family protein